MTEKYFEVEIRDPAAIAAQERKAERKERRRKERRRAMIQRVILASALLILVAIVAARALPEAGCTETPPTPAPVERVETRDTVAIIDPDMGLLDPGTAQDPPEAAAAEVADTKMITDAMVEILLTQGYLSDAVPLPYEYQDYMRFFSAAYKRQL